MIVSIISPIGGGKTSIIKKLQSWKFPVRFEPFKDNVVLPFFLKSKEDINRLGFACQVDFLTLREIDMDSLQIELLQAGKSIGFLDSGFTADECFARMLWDKWHEAERKVYMKISKRWRMKSNLIPDIAIYLDHSPEECLKRIKQRIKEDPTRSGESIYDLEYLQRLQASYYDRMETLGRKVVRLGGKHGYELFDTPEDNAELILKLIGGMKHG